MCIVLCLICYFWGYVTFLDGSFNGFKFLRLSGFSKDPWFGSLDDGHVFHFQIMVVVGYVIFQGGYRCVARHAFFDYFAAWVFCEHLWQGFCPTWAMAAGWDCVVFVAFKYLGLWLRGQIYCKLYFACVLCVGYSSLQICVVQNLRAQFPSKKSCGYSFL